jgi:toxin YoeB
MSLQEFPMCRKVGLANLFSIGINHKIFSRITKLLEYIDRTPFKGMGKPELLKHKYKGYWGHRITKKLRLVYKVSIEYIWDAKCRGHY